MNYCEQRFSCLTRRCFVLINEEKKTKNEMKTLESRAARRWRRAVQGLEAHTFIRFMKLLSMYAYPDLHVPKKFDSKVCPGTSMIFVDKLSETMSILDGWTSWASKICYFLHEFNLEPSNDATKTENFQDVACHLHSATIFFKSYSLSVHISTASCSKEKN